jgi:hypothetical protein
MPAFTDFQVPFQLKINDLAQLITRLIKWLVANILCQV